MSKTQLVIHLQDEAWEGTVPHLAKLSNEIVKETFEYVEANEDISFLKLNKPIIINLALSDDKEIRELNNEYRGKNKATNVLSFAAIDNDDFEQSLELFDEIELGDIVISLDTLKKEAIEKEISLLDHYCHLLVHGLLHLLGFDHENDEDADYMEDLEVNVLEKLDVKNPYGE